MSEISPPQTTGSNGTPRTTFDTSLLTILRCPITKSLLRVEDGWLIAEVGGLAYPIRDGIPVMLPESAKLPAGVESLDSFKKEFGTSD